MANISALLQHFSRLRALVIGDAMLDSYVEGKASRLCREGPVPIVRKTAEFHLPGGAANTAANLRALGAEVDFLGLIGRDTPGARLRDSLRERGVSIHGLVESSTGHTLHKLRILADGQYVVRVDEGELRPGETLAPELERALLNGLEELYVCCDLVVVSDYGYGVVSEALVERLRALHREHPKILLIDAKHLAVWSQVPAMVVTPNYAEAWQAMKPEQGQPAPPVGDLAGVEELGRALLKRLATEHVAITLGNQGVLVMGRGGLVRHVPAYPVAHANDIGAGDSFASAMALALAAGATVEDAARLGVEAACIAVSKRWTALVSLQELQQRLVQQSELPETLPQVRQAELAELVSLLEQQRRQGQKIVFTNGIFDILHIGHIRLLRQAKMLGDILVVGLNSDASARRLKGEGRPINNERERMALVAALDVVDYVLLFDEDTPTELIRALRPHIHVKGGDYTSKQLPEAEAVREGGGNVVILPLEDGKSTSETIARIAALTTQTQAAQRLTPAMYAQGGEQ
jgi:D-beta-D-heptose 7-phosphate kinase/D-beta-D-heptose 1-phosphate adenosyltransferase